MNRWIHLTAVSVLWTLLLPRAAVAQDRHGIEALAIAAWFSEPVLSDTYGTHFAAATRYVYRQDRWSLAGEVGWRSLQGTTRAFGFGSELRVGHVAAVGRVHLPVSADSPWTVQAGAGILHQRLRERVDFAGDLIEATEGATGLLVTGGVRRRLGSAWGVLGEGRYTRLTAPSPGEGVAGTPLGGFEIGGGLWLTFR